MNTLVRYEREYLLWFNLGSIHIKTLSLERGLIIGINSWSCLEESSTFDQKQIKGRTTPFKRAYKSTRHSLLVLRLIKFPFWDDSNSIRKGQGAENFRSKDVHLRNNRSLISKALYVISFLKHNNVYCSKYVNNYKQKLRYIIIKIIRQGIYAGEKKRTYE